MPRTRAYESQATSDVGLPEAPAGETLTDVPGEALPKDSSNWGTAARWFMLALLAIGFVVALYVAF